MKNEFSIDEQVSANLAKLYREELSRRIKAGIRKKKEREKANESI